MTDKNGQAAAPGLKTNEVPGKLQIYVTASYRGLRARALINQLVEAPPGSKSPTPAMQTSKSGGKWKWVMLGIAAAGGAGAGIYFGTHNSDSTSGSSPISISTGTSCFWESSIIWLGGSSERLSSQSWVGRFCQQPHNPRAFTAPSRALYTAMLPEQSGPCLVFPARLASVRPFWRKWISPPSGRMADGLWSPGVAAPPSCTIWLI